MKKFLNIIMLIPLLFLASCSSEKSQDELYQEVQSGVVMIYTKYYYQLTLPNGSLLYFSGLDSDGDLENLSSDVSDAKANCQVMTGTGFFVDKNGSILTNRHVVNPQIDEAKIKEGYRNLIRSLGSYYISLRQNMSDEYDQLEASKSECSYWDGYEYSTDYDKLNEIVEKQQELQNNYQELGTALESLSYNYDASLLKIRSVCEIGIAYNDTYVTNENDFLEKNTCVLVRNSDKETVDLALIQLKNKKTPEGKYIFSTSEQNEKKFPENIMSMFKKEDDGKLKMGQQLYMVGYNAGPILASTRTGIKVQMTSGKVTQLPDGQRLLYDIATVQGSSGSPVIDAKGNLVAVNFAKLNGSDNFNFGIPVERVRDFMKY